MSNPEQTNNTLPPDPRSSLLKILGFILLAGSVTLVCFQSAMIAIATWS